MTAVHLTDEANTGRRMQRYSEVDPGEYHAPGTMKQLTWN